MESSHASLIEHTSNSFLTQLELHFGCTSLSLLLRINPFTGVLERELSEPRMRYWCEALLHELYTAMDSRLYLYELLGRLYVHAILFSVARCFGETASPFSFVLSEYEQQPCLLLPCITGMNYEQRQLERWSILVRLTNNTGMHRTDSVSSFTRFDGGRVLKPSRDSYHTINNKMDDLNEYPVNVEVGFDIDDSAKEENEDEDEEEWMIEMTGVREVGQSMELIDSVKKTIMWEENDAALLKEIMARKQKEMEKKQEFRTKAKRELDQLQKQRMYKRTTLRVYLPDKTVIQAYFAPRETVGAVMEVVRGALIEAYQQLPFYLFCAPPKEMCDW